MSKPAVSLNTQPTPAVEREPVTPPRTPKIAKTPKAPAAKGPMTAKQIEALMAKEAIVFETAKKIRMLLDEARETYGVKTWNARGKEAEIIRLLTEEV